MHVFFFLFLNLWNLFRLFLLWMSFIFFFILTTACLLCVSVSPFQMCYLCYKRALLSVILHRSPSLILPLCCVSVCVSSYLECSINLLWFSAFIIILSVSLRLSTYYPVPPAVILLSVIILCVYYQLLSISLHLSLIFLIRFSLHLYVSAYCYFCLYFRVCLSV